jgi:hypothetical protein
MVATIPHLRTCSASSISNECEMMTRAGSGEVAGAVGSRGGGGEYCGRRGASPLLAWGIDASRRQTGLLTTVARQTCLVILSLVAREETTAAANDLDAVANDMGRLQASEAEVGGRLE